MKKNTLRVIATLLACATLASGSATAMADEASLPSMDEVPNSAAIEHEAHSLSVQPTADKQYAYPAEAEASGIFPTKMQTPTRCCGRSMLGRGSHSLCRLPSGKKFQCDK